MLVSIGCPMSILRECRTLLYMPGYSFQLHAYQKFSYDWLVESRMLG